MKLNELKKLTEDFKDEIIKKYGIKKYTINEDGSIDVNESVMLNGELFDRLPIFFNKVYGDFYITECPNLESLVGSPTWVEGNFSCVRSPKLLLLRGGPKTVEGTFECTGCPKLTSLKGAPTTVTLDFNCAKCGNLTTLEGAPEEVGGNFYAFDCFKLPKLSHVKSVKRKILLNRSPIDNFLYALKIKNLQEISTGSEKLDGIINKYLGGDRDIMACQEEMIDAGFEKYARLK